MTVHLSINGKDYTPYIVAGSYNVNTEDKYDSWEDGNMIQHRVIASSKVVGSIQLCCSEETTRFPEVSTLLADLNAVTDNGVLSIGVYVPSLGTIKAVDCYYKLDNVSHIKSLGNKFTDIFELKITER